MKLLVINPNTGQATTDRLQHFIAQSLRETSPDISFTCITAKFGFPYIASEESYAVATHAVLETWKAYKEQYAESDLPDRILLGCFFYRTRGERWKPMPQRLTTCLGCGRQLASIETVKQTGVERGVPKSGD